MTAILRPPCAGAERPMHAAGSLSRMTFRNLLMSNRLAAFLPIFTLRLRKTCAGQPEGNEA